MTELGRPAASVTVPIVGRDGHTVELTWGAATDIGRKRRINEDSYLAESPLFVVADGMGGHSAGDVASAAVVTRLSGAFSAGFADPEAIITALREATSDITLAADDDDLGVGTTVTGIALAERDGDPFWLVFNIGDSRVYQLDGSELAQLTVDHSVVQELVDAGLIALDEAEFHPDSNVITRAVGFGADPVADFWMVPVVAGARLLVCSDGLTREVPVDDLREILGEGRTAEDTAAALVAAALAGGGRDNITTIVVDVVACPPPSALETTIPRAES